MPKQRDQGQDRLIERIYDFYRLNERRCLVEYDLAEDPDISSIYCTGDIRSFELELAKVSVVILTANKFEKNILHQHVYKKTGTKIRKQRIKLFENPEKHNYADCYLFRLYDYNILHIACRVTGSYTIGGCADAVRYCIENPLLFPTAYVSFGICFGCREEKDHLCDVVLSNKVYPYFMGAKIDGVKLSEVDDYVFATNSELDHSIFRMKSENKFESFPFKVNYQNYITGEAVVSSKEARDIFTSTTTQEIFAGDMEAYGLYKECYNGYREISCLVIKAICDWGILKNVVDFDIYERIMGRKGEEAEVKSIKDKLQALAACNAYEVLDLVLREGLFEQAIYTRIQDKFINEEHEHVWTKSRVKEEAECINASIRARIEDDYVEAICELFSNEGIGIVEEKHIRKISGE